MIKEVWIQCKVVVFRRHMCSLWKPPVDDYSSKKRGKQQWQGLKVRRVLRLLLMNGATFVRFIFVLGPSRRSSVAFCWHLRWDPRPLQLVRALDFRKNGGGSLVANEYRLSVLTMMIDPQQWSIYSRTTKCGDRHKALVALNRYLLVGLGGCVHGACRRARIQSIPQTGDRLLQ